MTHAQLQLLFHDLFVTWYSAKGGKENIRLPYSFEYLVSKAHTQTREKGKESYSTRTYSFILYSGGATP
jgi:hypothetical protein